MNSKEESLEEGYVGEMEGKQSPGNAETQEKKSASEGLPMESSPYVNYKDVEDYKLNAYGTQGHLPVKPDQGGGGTDAPTLSGRGLPEQGKAAPV